MSQKFGIDDTVKLDGLDQELVVDSFSKDGKFALLKGALPGHPFYSPVDCISLVRKGGRTEAQAEPSHPQRIETDVRAQDVTSTHGGGYKAYEPRRVES